MQRFCLVLILILSACLPFGPLPAGTPAPTATASPVFSVHFHPDGPLYVGDQVSLEVLPPAGYETAGKTVRLAFEGRKLAEQTFAPFGLGARQQATFFWVWPTTGLEPGSHTLTLTLIPDQLTWTETVTLHPAAGLPPPEPEARWETFASACCEIAYITGTSSERDLPSLAEMADSVAAQVETRFDAQFQEKIPLTFLPRTLGHGGFTYDGIYVSYLDQNYAGSTTRQVLHHEMVHWLDGEQGGKFKPSILVEGLAVYFSGGHFKEEPILPRAAALLDLGWYIPLRTLAEDFYTSQHEIGYLEAAALDAYLIETYGWPAFRNFYYNIERRPNQRETAALETALQNHFSLSLDELETAFIAFLRTQTVTDLHRTDLRLSVAFYDTVRHYQQALDPSAYFLTAWRPDLPAMRQREIVADVLRHPQAPLNTEIETLLTSAEANLRAGKYLEGETNLRAAQALLELWGRFR